LAIGKLFGAQTIVSGAVNRLGTGYRIRIRALEVQTAQVQGQYNRNIASSRIINSLLASGGSTTNNSATGTITTGSGISTSNTTGDNRTTTSNDVNTPLTVGTMVPGNSLAEKLAWLQRSAESHNTYIIEVNSDESISPKNELYYKGAINITIVLRGDNKNRTIRLSSHGNMFTVNKDVTFILENNITLQGHNENTGAIILVDNGTLKMRTGSTITGNRWDNKWDNIFLGGSGVTINRGTFEMTGGNITDNTTNGGGGVCLGRGTFTISGGTISNNSSNNGGGVYVSYGTFNMRGGIITNNTANKAGGGVYILRGNGTFTKTGGTITGYNSDPNNGNVVKDEAGNVIARNGHAAFINSDMRKETTAGPSVNLSSNSNSGWDN